MREALRSRRRRTRVRWATSACRMGPLHTCSFWRYIAEVPETGLEADLNHYCQACAAVQSASHCPCATDVRTITAGPTSGPGQPQASRTGEVRHAPCRHGIQYAAEPAALVRQVVLGPRRTLAVGDALDQALLFEPLQPLGQQVGRDLLLRGEKLAVAGLAGQQIAHDQQRPAIAEQVQRAG